MKVLMDILELQEALHKVDKGVGNGKMLPITKYIEVIVEDSKIMFISTDLNIWVTSIADTVETMEEGRVVVLAHKFKNLIDKTTVNEVLLSTDGDTLIVKGNGEYRIETIDEEFPDYTLEIEKEIKVKSEELIKNININKSAIDDEMVMPCLASFYIGDTMATTNSKKMCYNTNNILKTTDQQPFLLGRELADKLDVLNGEVSVELTKDNAILFTDRNTMIYGPLHDGIENYPDIQSIVHNFSFEGKVEINTSKLNNILGRLSIFKNTISTDGVTIKFAKNFMLLSDLKDKNKEFLNYTKKHKLIEDFEIKLNIDYLVDILSSIPQEVVTLYFGEDSVVLLEMDNVNFVLASLEDAE